MVVEKSIQQILWEIYLDGCRRLEAELWRFAGPLNDWIDELLERRLPADWRARLGAYLDSWEPEGFEVAPDQRCILEDWILDWAKFRGLLPAAKDSAQTDAGNSEQSFVMAFTPNASGPPKSGSAPVAPTGTFVDGIEVAGPGPEVTASYKAKVQQALDVLDPKVGNWWQANSVRGQVRARAFWVSNYESHLEANDLPVIVVDQNYTAGQTAQAIIAEVSGGWFADSIGVYYKKYKFARKGDYQEFLAWQQGAAGEAARLASVLAELYFNGIATLTVTGDLVVTLGDLADNGPRWDQLMSILPLVGHLPIGAIVLKLRERQVRLPKAAAQRLEKLSEKERKSILIAVAGASTDDEAAAIIRREVARQVGNRQIHHAISETVFDALEKHKNLKGKYRLRDERFSSLATSYEAHHGYEDWHRKLDKEIKDWLEGNRDATEATFEAFLRKRYTQPDLKARFPQGF